MVHSSLSRLASITVLLMLLSGLRPSVAAAQSDVIRGRVTTTEGLPLPNVRVTATSTAGNVTREARTNNQGNFQIAFPNGTGDYIMGYALIGYTYRQFEIKRVADEDVLLADAALSVVQLDTVVTTASNQQRVNRNDRTPDVSGTEQTVNIGNLPIELIGDIAAMAASLPGVTLVPGLDGNADGFSVLGLGADQNTTTLNGMAMNGANLPRDANIQTSLTTSPYDASRGGFSGANFNIRPGSGSNFRVRGTSLQINSRSLEWTDPAAQAVGAKFTNLSLGGTLSGPIQYNRSFYSLSYQIDHRSNDNLTLMNTTALGLRTAGVAPDSVDRLLNILRGRAVPLGGNFNSNQSRNAVSVFGNIDLSPPNSSSGQSVGLTFNGNWSKQSAAIGGATIMPSANGDRMNWGGGIQGRHSSYLGMILSESQLGFNISKNYGDPYVDLPAGRVLVASDIAGTTGGLQSLTFGGSQSMSSSSRTINSNLQNTLSWFDDGNKHRIKLSTELGYTGSSQNVASNLLGTFNFNSLADLDAGTPASFTRTLTAQTRSTGLINGGMSIGDSYRRSQDLQIQYSLRVDASHFTASPEYNQRVNELFRRRNDRIPTPFVLSPRIGFSKTLGQSNDIAAFTGAFRAPRAIWRGGIGVFSNNASSGFIASALDNTGLPTGVQTINCVGPAAPIPNWAAYSDISGIPTTCADGTQGTLFASSAPNVTLVAKNYRPQRSIRANTSWSGAILDSRFNASVDLTYSLNQHQQRTVDLNFNPATQFTLADDGRPIYAQASSIIPTTGTIASTEARVSQEFSHVSELRSDLESQAGQVTLRLSPISRGPTKFTWNLAYTYQHLREQVSGFASTAANPLDVAWATSSQGPHSINYGLGYNFFRAVQVSWNGVFRSGSYYTPVIGGDVNGDGFFNDRAFIYSTSDSALGGAMQQLLSSTSPAARKCLEKQVGKIADRNTCHGPWTSSATLNITLDRVKFRMPQRANVQFSLSNPLGAADLAINHSGNLKGWGQQFAPDSRLLQVRGFDPVSKRYIYDVNQRFGQTRPNVIINRNPVVLNTQIRFDIGAMRERQSLAQMLGFGRTLPGSRYPDVLFRNQGTSSIANPMSTILRQQDSLKLTSMQADSIASMNRRYLYRSDSLWAPVARYLAKLPESYHEDEAWDRFLAARRAQIDLLAKTVPMVNALLTSEQKRKLPQLVINVLDPLYLASVRSGTGMYVGGSSIGVAGAGFMSFAVSEMMVVLGGGDFPMKTPMRLNLIGILVIAPSVVIAQGGGDSAAVRPAGSSNAGPPVRRIATASAVSTMSLGGIYSVLELPDGRVLVNDGQARRLLLMDTTLSKADVVLDSIAEVENTYGIRTGALISYRADSALFIDPNSLAVLVIDPMARITRVRSMWRPQEVNVYVAGGFFGWPAADANGRIVFRLPAQPAPPKVAPPPGVPYIPQSPDSAFIVAIDIETRKLDTLGVIRIPKTDLQIRMSPNGSLNLFRTINPLPSTDEWAVMSDGSVAFVRGRDYRIDYVASDGSHASSGNLPYDWQRLTEDLKQKLVDSVKAANRKALMTSFTSAMIRWANMYKKQYPPNFKVPDDYAPPAGFMKDWKFPDGLKFSPNYIYGCPPGVEPTMTGGAPASAPTPAMPGSPSVTVPSGTPSCIPSPVIIAGNAPPAPEYRDPPVVPAAELPDYRPPFATGAVRADADNNLWIRPIQTKPVAGGPVYDVVNRAGQMIDRLQLPPGYTIVGFGRGRVVYLSMRDAKGLHLARVRLR